MRKFLTFLIGLLCTGNALATEVVSYELIPATGKNNSYAGNCDIEIEGVTWNLNGNSQQLPWRLGGKSLSNVDRTLYSKTAIADNISKIAVFHGNTSGITVNSLTIEVASDSTFGSIITTATPTFAKNDTAIITRPEGKDWSNAYYRFVYNVSVSSSKNNGYVEFGGATFYTETDKEIVKTLKSITLSEMTIEYKYGAAFSFDGVCTAIYSVTEDGVPVADQQKVVIPTSVSEPDMALPGVQTITVSYTEDEITKEASYEITVKEQPTPVILPGTSAVMTAGVNASDATVNDSTAIKVGTSNNNGDMTITIPANTTAIHFFAAAWKDKDGDIHLYVPEGVSIADSDTLLTLVADAGIANNSPFTLYEDDLSIFRFDVELSNVDVKCDVTLASGSAKRFVVWGATYEVKQGPATGLEDNQGSNNAVKVIQNGRILIKKNNRTYNVLGTVID